MTESGTGKTTIERALILSGGGARGSYQVGVIKYLNEIGWIPDMVCGTSIGAINAVAYGSGLSTEELTDLWFTYDRKALNQYSLRGFVETLKSSRQYSPPADIRQIEAILAKHLDIDALRNSNMRTLISTLNMKTGQIRYFSQNVIEMAHIMAASAMPMVFPWQYIDGDPHWDAGLMVNTPIAPALALNAREIVVILHSPAGMFDVDEPKSGKQVFELALEHILIGSYMALLPDPAWQNTPDADVFETPRPGSARLELAMNGATLHAVAPRKMMGLPSMFRYSREQADSLIKEGYMNAKMQLRGL